MILSPCMSAIVCGASVCGASGRAGAVCVRSGALWPDRHLVQLGFQAMPDQLRRAELASVAHLIVTGDVRVMVQDAHRNWVAAGGNLPRAVDVAWIMLLLRLVDLR